MPWPASLSSVYLPITPPPVQVMKAAIGPSEQGILGFRYPEHGLDGRIWAQGWHIPLALPIFYPKRRSIRSSKGG